MKLTVTYDSQNSKIDVFNDFKSLMDQLSECYNDKIQDLQNEITSLRLERNAIKKALKDKNYKSLETYFGI